MPETLLEASDTLVENQPSDRNMAACRGSWSGLVFNDADLVVDAIHLGATVERKLRAAGGPTVLVEEDVAVPDVDVGAVRALDRVADLPLAAGVALLYLDVRPLDHDLEALALSRD